MHPNLFNSSNMRSHLDTSKVNLILSCQFFWIGLREPQTQGLSLECQNEFSSIYIFTFIVRTVRIAFKYINRTIRLFMDFCESLASLARLSLARAFCKTWLTSRNSCPSSFFYENQVNQQKLDQQNLYQKLSNYSIGF